MFLKADEFRIDAVPSVAPVRRGWSAPIRLLVGMLFLLAWLPVALFCWVGLTAIIAMKLGVDAADYAGDAMLGSRSRR